MRIQTLTPEEATQILRSLGMKISAENLRQGIRQGVYSFGIYIDTANHHPIYQIFKKQFDRWIRERADDEEDQDRPYLLIGGRQKEVGG